MSQSVISVHPQIKKIIQNLDLDLGLELSRYENSHSQESVFIPDSIVEESLLFPEKQFHPQQSHSSLVYNPDDMESVEPIPVASRIINESTSILDIILTPWGMMGIILFFGANIFIFFNLDKNSFVKNNSQSEIPINNLENQNQENNIIENKVNLSNGEKTENHQSNSNDLQPPSLPTSLPEINNSNVVNNSSQNSNLYPDLKSALFAEIQKNQQPLTPPLLNNNLNSSLTINNPPSEILNNLPPEIPSDSSTENSNKSSSQILSNSSVSNINQKYYLLSNYENMDNFNRIKKIAPNALIMNLNQEMKIQLGIFKTEMEARNQGQKLQNQGFKIYIQPM